LKVNDDSNNDVGDYVGANDNANDEWWWCPWQLCVVNVIRIIIVSIDIGAHTNQTWKLKKLDLSFKL
jgi:hypothetical protein